MSAELEAALQEIPEGKDADTLSTVLGTIYFPIRDIVLYLICKPCELIMLAAGPQPPLHSNFSPLDAHFRRNRPLEDLLRRRMAASSSPTNFVGLSGVRIVVVGDVGTGKSSLIVAAATESFPENVPSVLPPTRPPVDYYPDRVPLTIIDTSSRFNIVGQWAVTTSVDFSLAQLIQVLCDGKLPFVGMTEKVEQELAWKATFSSSIGEKSAAPFPAPASPPGYFIWQIFSPKPSPTSTSRDNSWASSPEPKEHHPSTS
ncbi:hypothetical protein KSP40_PGU019415 [Platanthera guangdongensis]|uniref:Uncharacterized protein n=1 Tax=Platanthera guangdongensis TaxID=2320717 RepID=A0ABR2MCE1_9ASPA